MEWSIRRRNISGISVIHYNCPLFEKDGAECDKVEGKGLLTYSELSLHNGYCFYCHKKFPEGIRKVRDLFSLMIEEVD